MFGAFPSVREQKKGRPPGSRTRRHVHTVETSPCGPRPWYLGPFAERPTLYFFGPCGPRPWYLGPFAERPTLYFFGPCGPRPWCQGPTAERPTLYFFGPCGPRPWCQGPTAERPTLYFFGPCGPRPWYLGPTAERPTLYFFGPCGPRPWYLGPTAERPTLYFFGPCDPRSWFLDPPPSGRPLLLVDDASRLLRPSATRSQRCASSRVRAVLTSVCRSVGHRAVLTPVCRSSWLRPCFGELKARRLARLGSTNSTVTASVACPFELVTRLVNSATNSARPASSRRRSAVSTVSTSGADGGLANPSYADAI